MLSGFRTEKGSTRTARPRMNQDIMGLKGSLKFMSFLSVLHTIEEDVLKGIAVAAPIVGTFAPAAGPILAEIASIIAALEGIGSTHTNVSPLVQAVATVSTVKQHAASHAGVAANPAA